MYISPPEMDTALHLALAADTVGIQTFAVLMAHVISCHPFSSGSYCKAAMTRKVQQIFDSFSTTTIMAFHSIPADCHPAVVANK